MLSVEDTALPDGGRHQALGTNTCAQPSELHTAVWGGIETSNVNNLQKMVNFAARVIYRKNKSEHVSPLLKNLNWLSVHKKLDMDACIFMYKMVRGLIPDNLCALFKYVHEVSERPTRQSGNVYEPAGRTVAGRMSLTYRGPRLYNNLPQILKEAPSLASFKTRLRTWLLMNHC